MYKAHIFHYGRYPLYFIFTERNANDSPLPLPLIEEVKELQPQIESLLLDGGYDSFKNHADIWYHLSTHPYIDPRSSGCGLANSLFTKTSPRSSRSTCPYPSHRLTSRAHSLGSDLKEGGYGKKIRRETVNPLPAKPIVLT